MAGISEEDKGKIVRKEKKDARDKLESLQPFELKRDLYLVHGWGDEANVCWTYPYVETGKDRDKNWKYTFLDWAEEKIRNHKERVHYVKLVKNGDDVTVSCDRWGKLQAILCKNEQKDKTYYYVNFFQFAELLKDKISEGKHTAQIDVVCHSMGGLDTVAAVGVNPDDDAMDAIVTKPLDCVNKLITVATPHRGSPAADLSDNKVAKLILRKNNYISLQGKNMSPKLPFIKTVNDLRIRKRLMDRITELHIFGGGADIVVPSPYYKFDTKGLSKDAVSRVTEYNPLMLAAHSQVMGITQDPRLLCNIFEILSK
jgi:hypothetical protein